MLGRVTYLPPYPTESDPDNAVSQQEDVQLITKSALGLYKIRGVEFEVEAGMNEQMLAEQS